MIDIVNRNGFCLKYIPMKFHDNIQLISKAVSSNGLAILFAKMTKNKYEVYRKAIKSNGYAVVLIEEGIFDQE